MNRLTYVPEDMAGDLLAGTAVVLPWVGAGVGGGVLLLFAFLGIRAGFGFFRGLAGESRGADMVAFYAARDEAKYRDDSW